MYSYTVVVTVRDMGTGLTSSFTHVVTMPGIFQGGVIRAAVLEAVASGQVATRGTTNVPTTGGLRVESMHIQSVYEGSVR